jgi:hypothetical protein
MKVQFASICLLPTKCVRPSGDIELQNAALTWSASRLSSDTTTPSIETMTSNKRRKWYRWINKILITQTPEWFLPGLCVGQTSKTKKKSGHNRQTLFHLDLEHSRQWSMIRLKLWESLIACSWAGIAENQQLTHLSLNRRQLRGEIQCVTAHG